MIDLTHKQYNSNVKLSGLSNGLDLDADKINVDNNSLFQQQIELEELKRKQRNKPFDPLNMDIPDQIDIGNVSFNPTDIKFDF